MGIEASDYDDIIVALDRRGEIIINSLTRKDLKVLKPSKNLQKLWMKNRRGECLKYFNICYKESKHNRMLLVAAEEGDDQKVLAALNIFAYVNSMDKKDRHRTPLQKAVWDNHLTVVKMLLQEQDLDMDKEDDDKLTALHMASGRRRLEASKMLVQAGADTTKKDYKCFTAKDWAEEL